MGSSAQDTTWRSMVGRLPKPVRWGGPVVAVVLAPVAWPVMVAGVYGVVVASTLRDPKTKWGLVGMVVVLALVAQGFWGNWLVGKWQKPATVATHTTKPSTQQTAKVAGAQTASGQQATVLQVVSGNEMDVNMGGQAYRVKLLGVSAPAMATESDPAACGANEAKQYLSQQVSNPVVFLQSDQNAGDRDVDGALLRYVTNSQQKMVNLLMLQSGMAQEATNETYDHQDEFHQAALAAQANNAGWWGECAKPSPASSSKKNGQVGLSTPVGGSGLSQ